MIRLARIVSDAINQHNAEGSITCRRCGEIFSGTVNQAVRAALEHWGIDAEVHVETVHLPVQQELDLVNSAEINPSLN
jgi:hypothetical protein